VEITYSMRHSIDMYRLLNWVQIESTNVQKHYLKNRMLKALGDRLRRPLTR
jgi:hypothetical protein